MTLEKTLYYAKYTTGSYIDAFASIPIWTAEKITKNFDKLPKNNFSKHLSWNYIIQKSPIYKKREDLRKSLGTRAGALFLQNNVIGAIPFIAVGIPAAELAQKGIENYLFQFPEMAKYATNSLITLFSQMTAGYTAFMTNEIRVNKEKYIGKDGKISVKKVGKGFENAVKAFLTFDLSYISLKTIGQSILLSQGNSPWKASAIFDSLASPIWYMVAIPLGIKNKIIEPKLDGGDKQC